MLHARERERALFLIIQSKNEITVHKLHQRYILVCWFCISALGLVLFQICDITAYITPHEETLCLCTESKSKSTEEKFSLIEPRGEEREEAATPTPRPVDQEERDAGDRSARSPRSPRSPRTPRTLRVEVNGTGREVGHVRVCVCVCMCACVCAEREREGGLFLFMRRMEWIIVNTILFSHKSVYLSVCVVCVWESVYVSECVCVCMHARTHVCVCVCTCTCVCVYLCTWTLVPKRALWNYREDSCGLHFQACKTEMKPMPQNIEDESLQGSCYLWNSVSHANFLNTAFVFNSRAVETIVRQ